MNFYSPAMYNAKVVCELNNLYPDGPDDVPIDYIYYSGVHGGIFKFNSINKNWYVATATTYKMHNDSTLYNRI